MTIYDNIILSNMSLCVYMFALSTTLFYFIVVMKIKVKDIVTK